MHKQSQLKNNVQSDFLFSEGSFLRLQNHNSTVSYVTQP